MTTREHEPLIVIGLCRDQCQAHVTNVVNVRAVDRQQRLIIDGLVPDADLVWQQRVEHHTLLVWARVGAALLLQQPFHAANIPAR